MLLLDKKIEGINPQKLFLDSFKNLVRDFVDLDFYLFKMNCDLAETKRMGLIV